MDEVRQTNTLTMAKNTVGVGSSSSTRLCSPCGLEPQSASSYSVQKTTLMSTAKQNPTSFGMWQHRQRAPSLFGLGKDRSLSEALHSLSHAMESPVSRRNRHFVPSNHKDEYYWVKRQKNNEAARKSREKRRMNDLVLEQKVLELLQENLQLKRDLLAVKVKYKEIDPEQMQGIIQYMAEQQKLVAFAKPDSRLSRLQLIMDEPSRNVRIIPKEEPLKDGVLGIHDSSLPSALPGQPRAAETQPLPITMLGNDWRKYFCHDDVLFPPQQKIDATKDTVPSIAELATYPEQDSAHLAATSSSTCEMIPTKKCRREPEICVNNRNDADIKPLEQANGSHDCTVAGTEAFVTLTSGGAGMAGGTCPWMDGVTALPTFGTASSAEVRIGQGARMVVSAADNKSRLDVAGRPDEILSAYCNQELILPKQSHATHPNAQGLLHQQHGTDLCPKDAEIGVPQSLGHEQHKSPSDSVRSDSSSGFESSESLSPVPNLGPDEGGATAGEKVHRLPCKLRFKLSSASSS